MSHLTELQRSAVQNAQALLESAGLSPRDLDSVSPSPSPSPSTDIHVASMPLHLCTGTAPAIQHARLNAAISTYYIPPPAPLASYPYPDLTLVILVILAFPFALYLSLQQSQYIWPDPFADEAYPCSVSPPD
ncbi:uncharacterized protein EDB93DRAFT_1257160 [Suillus bovinus]|uniref:uncharacterized protein n=1 Tax=Suillus bovinus TaxID=48563 RepID=UPI001B87EFBA|nr:uncharacterized protein EDB93DRAFT_1257160 [Suillus bovinus]KAG2127174.1 hypothetical protein EDB93DRAFT_1257160 [Suillus bovinus]